MHSLLVIIEKKYTVQLKSVHHHILKAAAEFTPELLH